MNLRSKEILETLIRREFDKNKNCWEENQRLELIQLSKDVGLNDLTIELENDN